MFVESKINKTHPDFDTIKYEVDNGMADAFSKEYKHPDGAKEDNELRFLDVSTELYGWTIASRPMNERAVMMKEFSKNNILEVKKMSEIEIKEETSGVEETPKKKETPEEKKKREEEEAKKAKEEKAKKSNEEKTVKKETEVKEVIVKENSGH